MARRTVSKVFSVGLALLLVFQMNALPIHEYNLRKSGYTLVNVQPWEAASGTEQSKISSRDKNFFNIALCQTHFRLNILQQFEYFFAGLLLLFGLALTFESLNLESALFRYDYFLFSLSSRAPPQV